MTHLRLRAVCLLLYAALMWPEITALAGQMKHGDPEGRPDGRPQAQRTVDRRPDGPGTAPGIPIRHGAPQAVPGHRMRHYRNVMVVRPHGHFYPGYGFYYSDDEAYKWLAFTAITLKVLDVLNEQQQRAHEAAQVRATAVPVGETITWNDGGAAGAVTVLRDGTSSKGRYCREYQQEITVGGQTERAYGTACRQPDGSWEIISTRN